MLNILYDIDFGSMVVPYVGLGLGAAYVEANNVDIKALSGGASFNDTDWAFAYQGIVGVNLRIDENIDLFADYRYFSHLRPEPEGQLSARSGSACTRARRHRRVHLAHRHGRPALHLHRPDAGGDADGRAGARAGSRSRGSS